jgi:hypothetical protein
MFFIFGWGRQTIKNHGVVIKKHCSHCNNEDYWQLIKITTWFSLFFLPLIPYKNKYMLICPVCEYGIKLDSGQFDKYKLVAEANTKLTKGNITADECNRKLNSGQTTQQKNVIEGETVDVEMNINNNTELVYCAHCGNKNLKEANFCRDCGNSIIK